MDVREKAAGYLNTKPRTKHQVIMYLRGKGFEEEEIMDAVEELEKYRYIDDLNYSIMYFRYGFEKGRGIVRIKRELSEKGVSADTIEDAYYELDEVPDQYEAARQIASEMLAETDMDDMNYEEKRRLCAKVGRRLMTRGFSSDIVYKVMGNIK